MNIYIYLCIVYLHTVQVKMEKYMQKLEMIYLLNPKLSKTNNKTHPIYQEVRPII